MRHLAKTMRRLRRNTSGVAMIEFAIAMPFFLTAGLWGIETANYALVNMKVGQLAIQIADNASRIGDASVLQNRRIFEDDINDLLLGANLNGGSALDLYTNGRVIVSSLEEWDDSVYCNVDGCPAGAKNDGEQFIHWQRCMGQLNHNSSYGAQDAVVTGGMGPAGYKVLAEPDVAVIFVEIRYSYKPLITAMLTSGSATISSVSSFVVRDDRDLSGIQQRNIADPDPVASCGNFTNFAGQTAS